MNKPGCILWEGEIGPRQIGGGDTFDVIVHARQTRSLVPSIESVEFSRVGIDDCGNRWLADMDDEDEAKVRDYVLRYLLLQRFREGAK